MKYRVTIFDPLCIAPDHKRVYEYIRTSYPFKAEVDYLCNALKLYFQDEYMPEWEDYDSVNEIIESVNVFFPDVAVYVDEICYD